MCNNLHTQCVIIIANEIDLMCEENSLRLIIVSCSLHTHTSTMVVTF